MKKEKLFKKAWKNIDKNFDWNKVHKTMKALNWTWRFSPTTPSIKELKYTTKDLVEHACTTEHGYAATGGFYARRHKKHIYTIL